MHTEEEAKTKWCPFARYATSDEDGNAANRWKQSVAAEQPHALNPVPCRCIGSACMAWRWVAGATTGKSVTLDNGAFGYQTTVTPDKYFGYCGLASRPKAS